MKKFILKVNFNQYYDGFIGIYEAVDFEATTFKEVLFLQRGNKKIRKVFISSGLIVICSLSIFLLKLNFNKEGITNKASTNTSNSEIHDWNSSYYSLSEDELKESLNNKINESKGKSVVVFYDGGRCNAYIENVLSEMNNLDNTYNKILITNYNQSYIDSMYGDYSSSMLILGDENKYLSKDLDVFDSETEKMKNVIMLYENGLYSTKLEYNPRFEGSITKLIK